MEKDEIYDRMNLCNEIISEIQDMDETQAYILYSGTGIGKSSVSKKIARLAKDQNLYMDVIQIQSVQDNKLCEGFFIECIFKCIRKHYLLIENNKNKFQKKKYRKYSYNYYIKHQNFMVIKRLVETSVLNELKCKSIKTTLIQFGKIVFHFLCIKLNLEKNLEINNVDTPTMINYIKYVLKKGNIVLGIENTQNFDKTSMDALLELLIETKASPNYFIFEFTLKGNLENINLLDQLRNELNYLEINYNISELDKLEFRYIEKMVRKLYQAVDESFMLQLEKMYTGNIKKIENFLFNHSIKTLNDNDPTYILLQSLSNDQKYILAIVILNNANIDERLLKQIIENSVDIYVYNYNDDINYLKNRIKVLEERNKSICIKDNDTIDTWKKNASNFMKYEALAYKNCESILLRFLKNGIEYTITRKKAILLLWQLYNRFEVIKLNTLLKYVDEVVYEILSVNDLKMYLKNLIDAIYPNETSVDLLYRIFDICNRYQLIELENYCLDKISNIIQNDIDEKFLFSYYTYLLQKEEYKFLLEKIDKEKKYVVSTNFKYYIELFKIVAFASLNETNKCKIHVKKLEKDVNSLPPIQYGYFLRLAEAYDKRNIAIPKVKKSIEIFEKGQMEIQAAKSRVSLCFLYSITGNLKGAQTELDLAEKVLLRNIENVHVFKINQACLYLLNKNYSQEVWNMLSEAEKSANTRFDQIAIIINKIVWCIENDDFNKGRYYEKKGLELLELEYNKHLYAIFYYDCHVLYKKMNQDATAKKYYDLAIDYKKHCDTLKARLENKNEVDDQTTFLLQYPWHICFVSYWYFDYIL